MINLLRQPKASFLWALIIFFIASMPLQVLSDVQVSVNEKTLLKSWKLKQMPLELELISQDPKLIKAFFIARGFSSEIAQTISQHCIYQMIVHNKSNVDSDGKTLYLSLKNWHIKHNDVLKQVMQKEVWNKQWSAGAISQAARIAFRWATFPTEQVFKPTGDYGWGMVSMGLKPGEFFDLQVVWKENEVVKKAWIKGMQCPQSL